MFLHHFKADNTTNSELFEFLKYLERFPRYSKNKVPNFGGPAELGFWVKKKKKILVLQRPQGSIWGLTIFDIPKKIKIDAP